ncbi:MAG: hypothetical protein IK123_12315 [Lachnospiraceae bacterium]|nr:hypothetical protein [Lachnospiraceae bacterium]
MFLSPKKHILSNTIFAAAILRLVELGSSGIIRLLVRMGLLQSHFSVDDLAAYRFQNGISIFILILTATVFMYSLKKVNTYVSVIPSEDRKEMAQLQEEMFGERNSALTAEVIRKLLRIWFSILVGAQLMYDISSSLYTYFLGVLSLAVDNGSVDSSVRYAFIYNLTHGFKYQGMLVALLLGIIVTAIFLDDKVLKIIAYIIAVLFIISSTSIGMASVAIMGDTIGIVWSSVIFHVMDSVGLAVLALYMRIRYHGI